MLRGYRLALTALIGFLALCGASPPSEKSKQPEAGQEQQSAPPVTPDYAPYPNKYADACYRAESHDTADLCAQWRAALAAEESAEIAWWGNWLSVIGASLTLVGTGFIYWTLRETRRTANAAVSAVDEAGRAADAAHEANRIMREAERAWIVHNGYEHGEFIDGTHGQERIARGFAIILVWTNVGKTPATHVTANTDRRLTPRNSPVPHFDVAMTDIEPVVIGPTARITSAMVVLNDAETVKFMAGEALYIYVRIEYSDASGLGAFVSEGCYRITYDGIHHPNGQPEPRIGISPRGPQNRLT